MRRSLVPVATALLLAAGCHPEPDSERLRTLLTEAVEGVLWTSESDYPFVVFVIPGDAPAPPTRDTIQDRIAPVYGQRPGNLALADRAVEVTTVDDVLQPRIEPREWWTGEEHETARRLQALRDLLIDEVHGAQVFRIGPRDPFQGLSPDIDVFFVGTSDEGDLVGVSTVSIET